MPPPHATHERGQSDKSRKRTKQANGTGGGRRRRKGRPAEHEAWRRHGWKQPSPSQSRSRPQSSRSRACVLQQNTAFSPWGGCFKPVTRPVNPLDARPPSALRLPAGSHQTTGGLHLAGNRADVDRKGVSLRQQQKCATYRHAMSCHAAEGTGHSPTPYMLLRYSTCRTVRSRKERSFRTSIADLGHVQPMLVPSPPDARKHQTSAHGEGTAKVEGSRRFQPRVFKQHDFVRALSGSVFSTRGGVSFHGPCGVTPIESRNSQSLLSSTSSS